MSVVSTARVNDYEIGMRRQELNSIRGQIKDIKENGNLRPSIKHAVLVDLTRELNTCKKEYRDLCDNVRTNFV